MSDPGFTFTPPPEDLVGTPSHRIVARVPGPDAAVSALEALGSAGIDQSQVFVLCGDDGLRRLDPTGKDHGLRGRILRAAETIFALGDMIADDASFVDQGGLLVSAPARHDKERRIVASVLRDNGGTAMRYFGTTTFEEIG